MRSVLDADLPARWSHRQRLKNTLLWWIIRSAFWFFQSLPFAFTSWIGRWIGVLAPRVARRDFRRTRANLSAAFPDRPPEAHEQIARRMFEHLGVTAAELTHLRRFLDGPNLVELTPANRAVFDEALARGKGVIAITGHIGNWELLAQVVAHAGYPITSIAKPLYDPRLTRWVHQMRTAWGHRILWRGDSGVPKQMLRIFRRNEILGLLIDQDTRVQGDFVPFFGRLAHTPTAAASLALRAGAAVVVGRARRVGGYHELNFERFPVPLSGTHERRVRDLTADLTAWLEAAIREAPEQWVWLHDRWKTRPSLDLDRITQQ